MKTVIQQAKKLLANKLVLGGLVALVVIVVVLVLVLSGGDGGKEPDRPATGPVSAKDLSAGDCVTDATSTVGDVTTFDVVTCAKPHDGEVYTIIELEGARYPGTEFINGKGQRGCRARLRRQATAKAFRDSDLGFKFVYPTKQSWAQGDHEITCLATFKKPRSTKLEQRAGAAS